MDIHTIDHAIITMAFNAQKHTQTLTFGTTRTLLGAQGIRAFKSNRGVASCIARVYRQAKRQKNTSVQQAVLNCYRNRYNQKAFT
jgi:hypothetical protein